MTDAPVAARVMVAALTTLDRGATVTVDGEAAHHLVRVMRVREGDVLTLFDGRGLEARGVIQRATTRPRAQIAVQLIEATRGGVTHDAVCVRWLQGYPKGEKLERVIRQATELGVRSVWPVFTARSVPRAKSSSEPRVERLRAIAVSAAEQCGRADVADVAVPCALDEALAALGAEFVLRLMPWEGGGESLHSVLARAPNGGECAVLVGPEGGLEPDEVERARAVGFIAVSLGPRIWRTETVAPALLATLSFARGDLSASRAR